MILYRLLLSRGFKQIYILKNGQMYIVGEELLSRRGGLKCTILFILVNTQQSHISDKKEIDISPPVA